MLLRRFCCALFYAMLPRAASVKIDAPLMFAYADAMLYFYADDAFTRCHASPCRFSISLFAMIRFSIAAIFRFIFVDALFSSSSIYFLPMIFFAMPPCRHYAFFDDAVRC